MKLFTELNQRQQRFIIRLRAMLAMSQDESNANEGAIAKQRYDEQKTQGSKYDLSQAEVSYYVSEGAKVESFNDSDFIRVDYAMGGKRIAQWKGFLIAACAYQQQCMAIKNRGGFTILVGPKSRIENTIWLYEQMLKDVERNCNAAWNRLSAIDKRGDNKRSFKNSYCLSVSCAFHKLEYDKREERRSDYWKSYTPGQAGLVRTANAIDVHSETVAKTLCNYGTRRAHTTSRSANGAAAGRADGHKVSNRRMTGSQRRLSAG